MKRIVLSLVLLLTLLLPTPAFAKEKESTGERIMLTASGTISFPANTAFYIRHGWGDMTPPYTAPGQVLFELEVDGALVKPTFVEYITSVMDYGPSINRTWYYNFPQGMSGQHTFTAHWVVPCGYIVTDCPNPMADYDYRVEEVVINFTP